MKKTTIASTIISLSLLIAGGAFAQQNSTLPGTGGAASDVTSTEQRQIQNSTPTKPVTHRRHKKDNMQNGDVSNSPSYNSQTTSSGSSGSGGRSGNPAVSTSPGRNPASAGNPPDPNSVINQPKVEGSGGGN
jgi:hypothetical protein